VLVPPDNRLSQSGTLLTQQALEAAGVPVLRLSADMVDAKEWDHGRMVEHVADFLRTRSLL
jgi:benzoyl-CoA reductase subunit B